MGNPRNPDEIIREYFSVNDEVRKILEEYKAGATAERRLELCRILRQFDQKGGSLLDELDASI
jgi:hypothetical protein